jgi:hypothetical protein
MSLAYHDIVGPQLTGSRPFDDWCFFGNNIWLTAHQVEYLNAFTDGYDPDDPFKVYVYKLTSSTVIPRKCKMVI